MWGYIYNFLSTWTNSKNKLSINTNINKIDNEIDEETIKNNVLKIENCYYTYHKNKQIKKWKENAKKELLEEINKIRFP
jgi:hypothetical protein